MTTPTDDQLAAAAKKARADHETAREIAARLLAPPTRRDRLQGGHGLGLAAEIAALNRWLALPTAEVAK